MRKLFTALMAMVLAGPSIAVAGPYVGLGIGGMRTETSLENLDLVPNLDSDLAEIGSDPGFSSSDVIFSAAVGWMFNRHFGVEVGYTNFGNPKQLTELPTICLLPPSANCQTREWTAEVKMDGFQAFLVGELPFSDTINGYVKLGAIRWNADYSGFERARGFIGNPAQIGPGNDPVSFDDDGTDFAAGLGVRLKTGPAISIRAELTYYDLSRTDLVLGAQLLAVYGF